MTVATLLGSLDSKIQKGKQYFHDRAEVRINGVETRSEVEGPDPTSSQKYMVVELEITINPPATKKQILTVDLPRHKVEKMRDALDEALLRME